VLSAVLGLERVTVGKAAGLGVATAGTALTLRVYSTAIGGARVTGHGARGTGRGARDAGRGMRSAGYWMRGAVR
jgi:hypothetical protein